MVSNYRVQDWVGRTAARNVLITSDMMDRFVELSGDRSPNHVSDSAAQSEGFERRVAQGWLLGSLASGLLGMELPALPGVEHEFRMAFRKPCYPGDEIKISLNVLDFYESVQTLILGVRIVRSDGVTLATGQIQYGLR